MMPQYWTGVVRERPVMDKSGEIARYLKWEYGNGTGLGFLTGWTADRESSPPRRFGFIERLREPRPTAKVRGTTTRIDDRGLGLGPRLHIPARACRGRGPRSLVRPPPGPPAPEVGGKWPRDGGRASSRRQQPLPCGNRKGRQAEEGEVNPPGRGGVPAVRAANG